MGPTHAPLDPSTAERAGRFGPIRGAIGHACHPSTVLLACATGVLVTAVHRYVRRAHVRLAGTACTWLQAVVDQLSEGIAVMDASGRVVVESRCLKQLSAGEPFARDRFGNPVTIDLRRPWGDGVSPDESPLVRAVARAETTTLTEFAARRADGQLVPVLVSAAPFSDAAGRRAGALMIVRDLSARRRFDRLREEWASLIVHDLQQPINGIVLRSDLLLGADLGPAQRDAVKHVRSMAVRLGSMVNDLNDSSQLETRRLRMNVGRVALGAVAREVLDHVPGAAARTTLRAPRDRDLFVQGDADRLEQVMTNLLSNALKYSPPDSEVLLELCESGEQAEVRVVNAGPGIPPDEVPRLFDRYMRSRHVMRDEPKGLGLGLYIAKGLVDAHGGRIWVDSAPNRTAFHFTIALDRPAMAAAPAARPAADAPLPPQRLASRA